MRGVTPNVMGVTWLTATTQDRGDIPIEPLLYIGLDYDSPLAEAIATLPQYIRLIWPGGRYQVLDAHTQQPVFTRDAPVDPVAHETFRRLTHHWGWWFLRLVWSDRQKQMFFSDFQIMQVGGKVYPLRAAVEDALNDLNVPREELRRTLSDALQYPPDEDRESVAQQHVEKYEALVGPLPAHLTVLSTPPGTHVVVDRQKFLDGTLHQADVIDAMWATQGKPRFEKVTVKPKEIKSANDARMKRPCERCGKTGPRYHYSVKVGNGLHNVCMDCADELGASEVFKRPQEEPKKSNHDWVVEGYLDALNASQQQAVKNHPGRPEAERFFRHAFARLREARVYELDSEDFIRLQTCADRYVAQLLGVPYEDSPTQLAENATELREKIRVLMVQVPMPSPLPFPSIYVGWGKGVYYNNYEDANDVHLLGWLLCEDGSVICWSRRRRDGHTEIAMEPVRFDAVWHPETINIYTSPWIATLLVAALNDKQTIILRQEKTPLRERLQFEKASKKARQRFLPRPYYTVTIQEQVVQDHARKLPRLVIPREWSHRFDRDAHYRHYVRRGPLPLSDRKRRDLTEAGFSVFTDPLEVTGEAMAILMRRNVPQMKAGEWLATKKTHVDAQLQIPHNRLDLPYVPAVRKPEGPLIPDPSKSG